MSAGPPASPRPPASGSSASGSSAGAPAGPPGSARPGAADGRTSPARARPLWQRFAEWSLRQLARLPFAWLHGLGTLLGRLIFVFARRTRRRIVDNIRAAGVAGTDEAAVWAMARRCAEELGKGLLEILPLWFGRSQDLLARVQLDESWPEARAIANEGRGAIFLTPHLGNFEMAGQFLAHNFEVTIMYRPPRIRWLDPLLRRGRAQGRATMTTADTRGVRALLKALRRGEVIGLLPDQVPARGHGVVVDFFGRPAYTSTLIGKLQEASGSPVIFICAARLPGRQGFRMTFEPMRAPLPHGDAESARALNAIQEAIIRRFPEQYLWSYNRYKNPIRSAEATGPEA